jgi:hypothetical protein
MKHLSSKSEYDSAKRMFVQEVKDVVWNKRSFAETAATDLIDVPDDAGGDDPF